MSRLAVALTTGDLRLPDAGKIAVFAPRDGVDLSALPKERCVVVTGFKPDFDHYSGLGFDCVTELEGRVAAAVVFVPRAKALARALVAQAASVSDGPVIIDGVKTDGVEPLLKAIRKKVPVGNVLSKAHGKLFSFAAGAEFADWQAEGGATLPGGFVTAPGVFSADGIDPASELLADGLPAKLGAKVADLGAGWGYLSARVLGRDDIKQLHLVEADHAALDCARRNVTDPRAQFHWADATTWKSDTAFDTIITNPPFHTGRKAEPGLGQAFLQAAARLLSPKGQLFLVANRHLPYESELARLFSEVSEIGGDNRFKLLRAARPLRRNAR